MSAKVTQVVLGSGRTLALPITYLSSLEMLSGNLALIPLLRRIMNACLHQVTAYNSEEIKGSPKRVSSAGLAAESGQ